MIETRHGAMVHALAPFATNGGYERSKGLAVWGLQVATTYGMASSVSPEVIVI